MSTAAPVSPGDVIEHVNGNVQHGEKLEAFLALIEQRAETGGIRPHLLTLQELQDGQALLVADRLGLAFVEAPNIRPGSRNALFYDTAVFRPDPQWVPYAEGIRHRPATARLHLVDPVTGDLSRRKLSVASIHGNFGNPAARGDQLRWLLSNMVKDGRLGFVSGDWNSWPQGRAPLSMDRVADRAYALDRSVLGDDGVFRPDDQADRMLTYRHMVWVGGHAATALGQSGADRPTTEHGPDKEQQRIPDQDLPPAGLGPIDRTYVTGELLSALISAEVLATPEVQAISDHLPEVTRWDRRKLWDVMNAQVKTVRH
ncbi:hypothetical protein [Kitasatospora phosalacinea]|uniref:Endonuclease/exonuclease/phosphatase domain-containing protein n=1 Tax=Kitasatospora phosalacinea TaxID=2065 RepID=A0A9W6PLM5_9ACTN|nr:hypothetical protein [Kitasatospora phosalacinea]GLW58550.1 hypothetical protein Kpho01_65610 [Kitasatospora phosalacinea]